MIFKSYIDSWNVTNKSVFLRADLNVPLQNNKILDDFRLQQILPTLDYLLQQGATVYLATHLGRPQKIDANLSTRLLINWFVVHGYTPVFLETITKQPSLQPTNHNRSFYLLENLRFYPEEYTPTDKTRPDVFAQKLSTLADFYVNDAFGNSHHADSSIALLPYFFDTQHRSVGFLIEQETKALDSICSHPKHPFALILGGNKILDKINILEALIEQIDTLLLCPAIIHPFLKASKKPIGASLIDTEAISTAEKIITIIKNKKINLVWPVDYLVSSTNSLDKYQLVSANNIKDNQVILSIGTKTVKLFNQALENTQTILINGVPGFSDKKKTMQPIYNLFSHIATKKAYRIVAGGDSIAALKQSGFAQQFDYLSSGGGATLSFLSNKSMPGLLPFIESQ